MATLNLSTEKVNQLIAVLGSEGAAKVFNIIDKGNKGQFIGLSNYESGTTNKKCIVTPISNVVVQLGSMAKKAKLDLEMIKDLTIDDVVKGAKTDPETAVKALANVRKSLNNKILGDSSTDQKYLNQRNGQLDSNIFLGNGFSIHIGEGETKFKISLYAFEISKEVIRKGVYEPTNKRKLTIVQDWIKQGFKSEKQRKYTTDNLEQINLVGEKVKV